jgi:DNA-directed RNA polymerase specialized sigma24 family protein
MSHAATLASQAPASAGVSAATLQPAIIRTQQGDDITMPERVEKISRLLKKLPAVEKTMKFVEDNHDRQAQLDAKVIRDKFVLDLKHEIDYAVNVAAFDAEPCTTCKLPEAPLEFIRAVADFEKPAMCACGGTGVVRVEKTDQLTVKAVKRIKYWSVVLDDYHRCCKIRAATSEAEQAYIDLEAANVNLLIKFGNEKQTSLEGADAEQGVRHGLIDAALRFDPLRKEGATFSTVAYNWCRRNSRARHNGQKRAGVYAPSIDAITDETGGRTMVSQVMSNEGALGTFSPLDDAEPEMVLDLREQVSRLPEDQRLVIEGELQGLSSAAIAEKLQLTKAKVRKLKAAAFATLKQTLQGYATALHD